MDPEEQSTLKALEDMGYKGRIKEVKTGERYIIEGDLTEIDLRIREARVKPKGLGRQFEQKPYNRIKYTPGDLYDTNGKRTYLKPSDE